MAGLHHFTADCTIVFISVCRCEYHKVRYSQKGKDLQKPNSLASTLPGISHMHMVQDTFLLFKLFMKSHPDFDPLSAGIRDWEAFTEKAEKSGSFGKHSYLTTNWRDRMGNNIVTEAFLDRMVHNMIDVAMGTENFREKKF